MALTNKLTAIGDAIRAKTGKTDLIPLDQMPAEIESIQGGGGDAFIKTVSGTCPIILEDCVEGKLLDYKIYGAEGGVGNKNKNLFNPYTLIKGYSGQWSDGSLVVNSNGSISDYIDIEGASKITATILTETNGGASHPLYFYDADKNYIQISDKLGLLTDKPGQRSKTFTVPEGAKYCRFYILTNYSKGNTVWAQVEVGDTFTGYVPYGYEIPVKVNDDVFTITSIYPQLGNGDYIDFENRVVVKNGVASYVNLPEVKLQNGQNTIDVETAVKPSKMSVSFVDNGSRYKHIHGTGEIDIHSSMCNQCLENAQFSNLSGEYAYTWNQLNDNGYISKPTTQNGVTFTNAGNGKLVLSGATTTNRVLMPVVSSSFMPTWDTSHKYYLRRLYPDSSISTIFWHTFNKQVVSGIMLGSDMNFTANYPRVSVAQGVDTTGIEITPQIFDLTAMFGEGNEPTMEQFEAMFPDVIYEYDSGTSCSKFSITIADKKQDFVYKTALSEYMPETPIIIPKGDSKIILNDATIDGDYYTSA